MVGNSECLRLGTSLSCCKNSRGYYKSTSQLEDSIKSNYDFETALQPDSKQRKTWHRGSCD